jgi:hypothetical protein
MDFSIKRWGSTPVAIKGEKVSLYDFSFWIYSIILPLGVIQTVNSGLQDIISLPFVSQHCLLLHSFPFNMYLASADLVGNI